MEKLSLIEKLTETLDIIKSSPFFVACFLIAISLLAFVLLDIKTTKKLRDKLLIVLWLLVVSYIFYNYFNYFVKISDNLVEEIFMAIYFPNLAIYAIIVLTTNFFFIKSLLSNKSNDLYRVCNLIATIIIDFIFILILETIIENKIDVYESLTMYSNQTLLILLEISSGVYTTWLILQGLLKLVFNRVGPPPVLEIKEVVEEKPSKALIYEAPLINTYVKEEIKKPNFESVRDYTSVFEIDDTIKLEKKFYISNLEKHRYIKKEEVIIPVLEKQIKHHKQFLSLFKKEKEAVKPSVDTYRVPLFESLTDDALMSMIEPISKPQTKVVTTDIVKNVTFELEEELFKKFKRGENLDVDQYKILKNYLIKKQI